MFIKKVPPNCILLKFISKEKRSDGLDQIVTECLILEEDDHYPVIQDHHTSYMRSQGIDSRGKCLHYHELDRGPINLDDLFLRKEDFLRLEIPTEDILF